MPYKLFTITKTLFQIFHLTFILHIYINNFIYKNQKTPNKPCFFLIKKTNNPDKDSVNSIQIIFSFSQACLLSEFFKNDKKQ